MSIFDKDIITRVPYDDYRQVSILFIKRQLAYGSDFSTMLNCGKYTDFCRLINERVNSCVNHEYNLSHGVKEEHISIHPIGNIAYCKYFQINSCITTLDECRIKLYSRCFCIKPDMFGYMRVVWDDEVKDLTAKEQFEKIK